MSSRLSTDRLSTGRIVIVRQNQYVDVIRQRSTTYDNVFLNQFSFMERIFERLFRQKWTDKFLYPVNDDILTWRVIVIIT